MLLEGALFSSAEFAYVNGGADTSLKLKYMPEGSSLTLNGSFVLDTISDGIAAEMSELLFSLPTSEVVEGTLCACSLPPCNVTMPVRQTTLGRRSNCASCR